ncbi:FAD-binding oxidoreductase [Salinibacterium hongtaonis]|uniref:FAD-binding oxidoreductase n=1 Tax=Homoserinimonas hongtaonis TaxID=2079791 RepID=UPI000D340BE7|nr:FAD-binding oxidoreductase [Salinibacterium hongtaonis]AWB90185.1 FAD-binding protein [Salinibacterium hongtaonis]
MSLPIDADSVAALATTIDGPVMLPHDDGYAAEVTGFNLAYPQAPDVVVGAANPRDVSRAVRFAVDHELPVRVFATGHGTHSSITDGMLITTRRMTDVTIDEQARTATVAAGATWADVQDAAAAHGLTAIPGSSPTVGVVGYLLGGGLGPLARSHGFSSDYVRSFEVVTAAGDIVRASADEHPDLLWALRGGKGGFGVVTSVELALVDLATVYGGALFFDTGDIDHVLRSWVTWTETAPDAVTTSVALLNMPPLDVIPEPLRGKTVVSLRFAFPGDADEGERLVAPLRSLATPLIDAVGILPTSQLKLIHSDPEAPAPAWSDGLLLGRLDDRFADTLLASVGPGSQLPLMAVEVRHLGSATAADTVEGSAVGGRGALYTMTVIGAPVPDLFETVLPQVMGGIRAAVAEWTAPETTINFVGDPASRAEFVKAWPSATAAKLSSLREEWDPSGTFVFGPH